MSKSVEIVECPYMPDGIVALKDAAGIVVLDMNKLTAFRLPGIEYELKMPESFRVEGDKVFGTMAMLWRFCPPPLWCQSMTTTWTPETRIPHA